MLEVYFHFTIQFHMPKLYRIVEFLVYMFEILSPTIEGHLTANELRTHLKRIQLHKPTQIDSLGCIRFVYSDGHLYALTFH